MAAGVEELRAPRADTERFCPYHGGYIRLSDCPVVATNTYYNQAAGAQPATPGAAAGDDIFGALDPTSSPSPSPSPSGGDGARVQVSMVADIAEAGRLWRSRVDHEQRVVLATAPGYARRLGRSAPELPSPAELAGPNSDASARPARACPHCQHPLPATIDYRDAFPVALVGHMEASKTSTILALIEEAGQRDPQDFGVDRLTATESTVRYLISLDDFIFDKFRDGVSLERTQAVKHPPLEFTTTCGIGGAPISMLIHDLSGEDLVKPELRLQRAPNLLWADAIIFIYNPEESPALRHKRGRASQANILNGIRDDLEARGPRDASGHPYVDPPLVVAVSKADRLPRSFDIRNRRYTDEDVQAVLRELGDGAVVQAARRFPTVHWRLAAPMPEGGGGPQGVVDVFSAVFGELKT